MPDQLRIAFLGCGFITRVHSRNLRRFRSEIVCGYASRDKARAADTIKRLLSNLATITQGIAELRNQYGTGHGRVRRSGGLTSRHAKLAVGAAATLAVFLVETHQVRKK